MQKFTTKINDIIKSRWAFSLGLTATFSLCFVLMWLLFLKSSDASPKLVLPSLPLSLGPVKRGQVAKGTFPIRNAGGGVLSFTINPSCGCTTLTPRQGTLKNGETVDIEVGIRLAEEGTAKNVNLSIDTNDKLKGVASYSVQAECPASLLAIPKTLDFGRNSKKGFKSISLKVFEKDGTPWKFTRPLTITSNVDWLKIEKHAIAGELTVDVGVLPTAAEGLKSALISLRTADQDGIDVPVSVQVVGEGFAIPSVIFLGGSDPINQGTYKIFVCKSDGTPLPPPKNIRQPLGVSVKELGQIDNRRSFEFLVDPKSWGDDVEKVVFEFDGMDDPIAVKLIPPKN